MPDQALQVAAMLVVNTLVTPTQDGVQLAIAPALSPSDPCAARTRNRRVAHELPAKGVERAVGCSPRGEAFGLDHAPG